MNLLHILLALIVFPTCLRAEILDRPVPWHGQFRSTSISKLVSEMETWSKDHNSHEFVIATPIPKNLATKEIDKIIVDSKPRSTYGDLLQQAFKSVGRKVVLSEADGKIHITYLYTKVMKITEVTKTRIVRHKKLSGDEALKLMTDQGIEFSPHFVIRTSLDRAVITVFGTVEDLEKSSRFYLQ